MCCSYSLLSSPVHACRVRTCSNNRYFYPTTSAHAASVPILRPREIHWQCGIDRCAVYLSSWKRPSFATRSAILFLLSSTAVSVRLPPPFYSYPRCRVCGTYTPRCVLFDTTKRTCKKLTKNGRHRFLPGLRSCIRVHPTHGTRNGSSQLGL